MGIESPNFINRIENAIRQAGIPIGGIATDESGKVIDRIDFLPEATPDQEEQAWAIAKNPPAETPIADWDGLYRDLINPSKGLSLYQKILFVSRASLPVNTDFTVFVAVLTATRVEASLQAILAQLLTDMEAAGIPFTPADKDLWNQLIAENNFSSTVEV